MNIKRLHTQRQTWVNLSKELEFDLQVILSGLYTSEEHFIYELIQNAEDVKATKASVELHENHLVFRHNARRKFDINDVKAITSIGASTKRNALNKIGKFGIGIKSVFAMAEKFTIYSGEYALEIRDFVVPVPVEHINNDDTMFVIWFKNESAFEKIQKAISLLPENILLFLNSIDEINIKINGADFAVFNRTLTDAAKYGGKLYACGTQNYLMYSASNSMMSPKIAFLMQNGTIANVPMSKFRCFFETDRVVNLGFLLHAPVRTTPGRDNISFNLKENEKLLNGLVALYKYALKNLANSELWNLDFMSKLPLKENKSDSVYDAFNNAALSILKTKPVWLTKSGTLSYISKSMLCATANLYNILDGKEYNLKILKDISHPDYAVLYETAKKYCNLSLNLEDFLSRLSDGKLKSYNTEYMLNLYQNIPSNMVTDNYEIIRTTCGKHIKAKDAYMKSPLYDYPERELAAEFKEINLYIKPSLSIEDFVRNVILCRKTEMTDDLHIRDLSVILSGLYDKDNDNNDNQEEYNSYLLISVKEKLRLRTDNGEYYLRADLNIRNEIHSVLDVLSENYKYVSDSFYRERLTAMKYEQFKTLIYHMEINDSIRVEKSIKPISGKTPDGKNVSFNITDVYIPELEKQIENITFEQSKRLLDIVCKFPSQNLKSIEYTRTYNYDNCTSLCKTLSDSAWLYDSSGKKVKPSETLAECLNRGYGNIANESNLQMLPFIKGVVLKEKIAIGVQKNLDDYLKSKSSEELLKLLEKMDNVDNIFNFSESAGFIPNDTDNVAEGEESADGEEQRKAGEKYFALSMNYLRDQYIKLGYSVEDTEIGFNGTKEDNSFELVVMDKIIPGNRGYDIHVKFSTGKEEFIEVKGSRNKFFRISTSQYAMAQKFHKLQLHEDGSGVYRVIFLHLNKVVYDSTQLIDDIYNDVVRIIPEGIILN